MEDRIQRFPDIDRNLPDAMASEAEGTSAFDYERRWQEAWKSAGVFQADFTAGRHKWFVVELPPFANGKLHVGHLRNYAIADVAARFHRMLGCDVLYVSGADAFGLPNENAARDEGCTPTELVGRNIEAMRRQFKRLGLSHDTRVFLADHEPSYYRWVQWVFLRLFEAGHAFRGKGPVNWCPRCRTTLADNLVENGHCWRCTAAIQIVEMERWFVRETDFADPLLGPHDGLPKWPDTIKKIHKDWIGRSEGIEIMLPIFDCDHPLIAFVSDLERLIDAEFVAVGPHHPLTGVLAGRARSGGNDSSVSARPVLLDVEAVEPLSGRPMPVVLLAKDERVDGHNVLLACPARDQRDRRIWDYLWPGAVPSHRQDRQRPDPTTVLAVLAARGVAKRATRYRLRDWDLARPRYWGTPVPIVHCERCGPVSVPDNDLPVILPEDVALDTPGNPLASQPDFVNTTCPRCASSARRDTDTIETYASPWWFYLMCKDPHDESPFDSTGIARWMPVDLMVGGSDQARTCFFHLRTMAEAMTRLGIVSERHPVRRLVAVGMVKMGGRKVSKSADGGMGLSQLVERHGADALRLAVLSAAAPDQDLSWSDDLVARASKFLRSVTAFFTRHEFAFQSLPTTLASSSKRQRKLANCLETAERRITGSLERCAFHVSLAQINFLFEQLCKFERETASTAGAVGDEAALTFVASVFLKLLAPFAPHLAEELWTRSNGQGLMAAAAWPCGARSADALLECRSQIRETQDEYGAEYSGR